jgi:hypothetical protein
MITSKAGLLEWIGGYLLLVRQRGRRYKQQRLGAKANGAAYTYAAARGAIRATGTARCCSILHGEVLRLP